MACQRCEPGGTQRTYVMPCLWQYLSPILYFSLCPLQKMSPLQLALWLLSFSSMWVAVWRCVYMGVSGGVWAFSHPCGIMALLTPAHTENMACIICPPNEINCTWQIGSAWTWSQAKSESGRFSGSDFLKDERVCKVWHPHPMLMAWWNLSKGTDKLFRLRADDQERPAPDVQFGTHV